MNVTPFEDTPDEQDQPVTVRLLPDGVAQAASLSGLNGKFLRLDLASIPIEAGIKAGDLVEVTCPRAFYLGEVCGSQGDKIIVGVEHSLDRKTLELIRETWSSPAGE